MMIGKEEVQKGEVDERDDPFPFPFVVEILGSEGIPLCL